MKRGGWEGRPLWALELIAPFPIGVHRLIVLDELVDLAAHLVFDILDIIVRHDANSARLHPCCCGQFRRIMTSRPNPLFHEEIDRIKISADAIVDRIQANHQKRSSLRSEPLTFREDFYASLLKPLPDIVLERDGLQSTLLKFEAEGFNQDFQAGKASQRFAFRNLCGPLRITWSQRKHESACHNKTETSGEGTIRLEERSHRAPP